MKDFLILIISISLTIIQINIAIQSNRIKTIQKQQTIIHQQDSIKWVELNNRISTFKIK